MSHPPQGSAHRSSVCDPKGLSPFHCSVCRRWWWPGGRMYDVIYFNVWSDIICTAAKLLHGTSALC